jgi:thiamine-monophosphate kinase
MGNSAQNENAVLAKIERSVHTLPRQVALGIGDDAALFRPSAGHEIILTCDWFLERTHFLVNKHPTDSVGWKCLARAVSDISAMGGIPRCFLLSLALPKSRTGAWLDGFLRGLSRASKFLRCYLAGGDTTQRNEVLINITVVGEVRTGRAIQRSGAKSRDILYVSGHLGEAELGLRLIRRSRGLASSKLPQLRKHLYPEPRLKLAAWLAKNNLATAMMDLSDGLSSDLPRLCRSSGLGATIEAERVPKIRNSFRRHTSKEDALELALHGGDDYELLFTVAPKNAHRIPRAFQRLPLTAIGEMTKDRHVLIKKGGRRYPLAARGWDPFRNTK